MPGTYRGAGNTNCNFFGRQITVIGSVLTVIDCEMSGRAFLFNHGETSASKVIGFKIIDGRGPISPNKPNRRPKAPGPDCR